MGLTTSLGLNPSADDIDEWIYSTIASYPGFSDIKEPNVLKKAKIIVDRMAIDGFRPITAAEFVKEFADCGYDSTQHPPILLWKKIPTTRETPTSVTPDGPPVVKRPRRLSFLDEKIAIESAKCLGEPRDFVKATWSPYDPQSNLRPPIAEEKVRSYSNQYDLGYDSLCPIGWHHFTEAAAAYDRSLIHFEGRQPPAGFAPPSPPSQMSPISSDCPLPRGSGRFTLTEDYQTTASLTDAKISLSSPTHRLRFEKYSQFKYPRHG